MNCDVSSGHIRPSARSQRGKRESESAADYAESKSGIKSRGTQRGRVQRLDQAYVTQPFPRPGCGILASSCVHVAALRMLALWRARILRRRYYCSRAARSLTCKH